MYDPLVAGVVGTAVGGSGFDGPDGSCWTAGLPGMAAAFHDIPFRVTGPDLAGTA